MGREKNSNEILEAGEQMASGKELNKAANTNPKARVGKPWSKQIHVV